MSWGRREVVAMLALAFLFYMLAMLYRVISRSWAGFGEVGAMECKVISWRWYEPWRIKFLIDCERDMIRVRVFQQIFRRVSRAAQGKAVRSQRAEAEVTQVAGRE